MPDHAQRNAIAMIRKPTKFKYAGNAHIYACQPTISLPIPLHRLLDSNYITTFIAMLFERHKHTESEKNDD
jgi:hypothetical protein